MAKPDKTELTPTEKRALQMMTPEGRAELFGGKKTTEQRTDPVASNLPQEPLVSNSPMLDDETLLSQSIEAGNKAQQEAARQGSMVRDAERELEYGSQGSYQGSPEYEARYAESSDPIENLNSLADTVGQERQDAIFNPPDLLPSGRAEFDAASRGEIPGYAIKDPGARSAFAKARMQDPKFGSQERARANRLNDPAGPDVPFDQELLDRIGNDIEVSKEKYHAQNITDPTEIAALETYRKAKANGKHNKLYDATTRGRYERALEAVETVDKPGGIEITDGYLGGFDYEGMGKRAQEGQQPRSAGGMGQGPLTNPRSAAEEKRLDKTFQEREEKFRDAIENADFDATFGVDAEFIEIDGVKGFRPNEKSVATEVDGKKYKRDKATEIYGNLQDRNSRPSGSRLRGEVVSDPASRGRGGRPYRMQTGHVGSARGGGPITQRRVKPGESGYSGSRGYGAPASGRSSGGETPPSMQQFTNEDGSFSTPNGFTFPNPFESDPKSYGDLFAVNPEISRDMLMAAEDLDVLTSADRTKLNQFDVQPRNLTQTEQAKFNSSRQRRMGEFYHGIATKIANESKNVQRRGIANQRAEESRGRAEENRTRSETERLRRVYWSNVDPETKNMLIDEGQGFGVIDPQGFKGWFDKEDNSERFKRLDEEQFKQAIEWEQQQQSVAMRAKAQLGGSQPSGGTAALASPSSSNSSLWDIGNNMAIWSATGVEFPATVTGARLDSPNNKNNLYLRFDSIDQFQSYAKESPEAIAAASGVALLHPRSDEKDLQNSNAKFEYYEVVDNQLSPIDDPTVSNSESEDSRDDLKDKLFQ